MTTRQKTLFSFGVTITSVLVTTIMLTRGVWANGTKEDTIDCNTIESCQALQKKIEARVSLFLPSLNNAVRGPDDRIRYMDQKTADAYCQRNGGLRVPTTREWASFAQTQGALGIKETEFPNIPVTDEQVNDEIIRMRRKKYYAIFTNNNWHDQFVDFYYSSVGYKHPRGDIGMAHYLSSSPNPEIYGRSNYSWQSYDGTFDDASKSGWPASAVCVQDR